ncbi:amidase [Pseudonocardia asaccharolytica]|uniref:Amidase domain-containing protein n=1 Tax=Pseudonocardia asaccharolytica DSM 44247 = NBRC 16224 TaxID=1123024 RepID=A0A511CVF1_9PSEU|nr:amidase [Pseudonocardia asaccharolytica]GEL16556.1 hypothetical protein PA7_03930 [Pseudonocardia asaccharolytica DSM 44247 = NBRC 16224]
MDYTDSDLHYISTSEAIAGFRAKELSPVELLQAVIDRIGQVNDQLNCFTHTSLDRAMEQARQAEQTYANSPEAARPLEGVPCAIKDWHSVAGAITTYGSRAFQDFRPDQSAPTVERLLEAGVVMHARTTTPEFAHSGATHSPLWGITRNPWNTEYSPGGSSGGAGAAVASGMTTIADGTDGGGSIRIPASANGIFGYKPPFGRNPTDREHPGETVLHYGPMTRTVADAALMQNVMSGAHPADVYTRCATRSSSRHSSRTSAAGGSPCRWTSGTSKWPRPSARTPAPRPRRSPGWAAPSRRSIWAGTRASWAPG